MMGLPAFVMAAVSLHADSMMPSSQGIRSELTKGRLMQPTDDWSQQHQPSSANQFYLLCERVSLENSVSVTQHTPRTSLARGGCTWSVNTIPSAVTNMTTLQAAVQLMFQNPPGWPLVPTLPPWIQRQRDPTRQREVRLEQFIIPIKAPIRSCESRSEALF